MNIQDSSNAGNYSTRRGTVSFSRTLFHKAAAAAAVVVVVVVVVVVRVEAVVGVKSSNDITLFEFKPLKFTPEQNKQPCNYSGKTLHKSELSSMYIICLCGLENYEYAAHKL